MEKSKFGVGFFLGSGCSFPSGQPCVDDITTAVLSGEYCLNQAVLDPMAMFQERLSRRYPSWEKTSDFVKQASDEMKVNEETLKPWVNPRVSIQKFLEHLSGIQHWSRPPNYEDLSGILRRIGGVLFNNTNDPAVNFFIEQYEIIEKLRAIEFPENHHFFELAANEQIEWVDDYIAWIIAHEIDNTKDLVGYSSLVETIRYLRAEKTCFHFATTNYDQNIERMLLDAEVEFSDGFVGQPISDHNGYDWRIGGFFEFKFGKRVQLIKLHGSTNWYTIRDTYNGSFVKTAICEETSLSPLASYNAIFSHKIAKEEAKHAPFTLEMCSVHAPIMLRGTLTKSEDYFFGIYDQLNTGLAQLLNKSNLIVVSGFGFADEGLNQRLLNFARKRGKTLLVLDGSDGSPGLRGQLGNTSFNRHVGRIGDADKGIILIPKFLSELSSTELIDAIETIKNH